MSSFRSVIKLRKESLVASYFLGKKLISWRYFLVMTGSRTSGRIKSYFSNAILYIPTIKLLEFYLQNIYFNAKNNEPDFPENQLITEYSKRMLSSRNLQQFSVLRCKTLYVICFSYSVFFFDCDVYTFESQ